MEQIVCPNGVKIVTEKINTTRAVSIGIFVRAGSRYEQAHENGMTHFIEHMLFKGTTTRTAQQISQTIDRIGGELNAYTSRDHTCYHVTVLDTHAEQGLAVLSDMFFNSVFDKEAIEKEKRVIYEEMAMDEDTPEEYLADHFYQDLYANHPLGRPILGTKATIENFTQAAILQYVKKYYVPEHIVVSLAGNISDTLIEQVRLLFGAFSGETQLDSVAPVFCAGDYVYEKSVEQAHFTLAYEASKRGTEESYALLVLDTIIGGTTSSRLFQTVREQLGLAYQIYSTTSLYEDIGTWLVYVATNESELPLAKAKVQEVIQEIYHNGVTLEEVKDAITHLQGSFVLGMESAESHMTRNGELLLHGLTVRTVDEALVRIGEVTVEEVNTLAKKMFSTSVATGVIMPI